MARIPDFFIIGAAKSGTTSLYEYLKGHPEIYMSPRKAPRYFAPELATGGVAKNLRYGEDRDRYLALFAEAGDEKRVGEASVRYIYSTEAPRLIRELQPDARIVAILRNPVDMLYSLHNQRVSSGAETIIDFEAALAADEPRRRGMGIPEGSNPILSLYRDRARYGTQLPRWFETFERDRVHVMIFEEFVHDPGPHFRRLLEFLEVDPDYQPPAFVTHNRSHRPRSNALRRLLNSRPIQWLLWRFLPMLRLDGVVRRLIRPLSRFNRRPAPRQPMSPELRRRLEEEFRDDVAVLSELIGRDLGQVWFSGSEAAVAEPDPALAGIARS